MVETTKRAQPDTADPPNIDQLKIKRTEVQQIDSISANKWWVDVEEDSEIKWKSLMHHGVCFTQRPKRLHLKATILGKEVELTHTQEEILLWYSKIKDTEFGKKPKVQANCEKELKLQFSELQSINDIDWAPLMTSVKQLDEKYKERSEETKKNEKLEKLQIESYYGYALVDGAREKISNFMVEPPGVFRGRGEHPHAGRLKHRILPENVIINIGDNDMVPMCKLPGHAWKKVVQNNEATWLACYSDDMHQGHKKYVFLDATSKFKGLNDMKKYEKAKKLKNCIKDIREDYFKMLEDSSKSSQQLGTAAYLIDVLALRVGNEKGEDEADTVGCCSLRVEHIKFADDLMITLDFLGKDSMRYFNTVKIDQKVYNNLLSFVKGKEQKDDLFDQINASKLNDYLKKLMPELSAKVFRTYNASITLQNELDKFPDSRENDSIDSKIKFYNDANRQVAILCNHQKTISKNFNAQSDKIQSQVIR
jgi:DNA topoisomerase-1